MKMQRSRGRPAKQTADEQVSRAMNVFWIRGYLDTTIEDLVDEAGANRFGLYAKHGGKDGLYREALMHYRRTVMGRLVAPLTEEEAGLRQVHQFFAQFLSKLDDPESRRGCLVCHTAIEAHAVEPALAGLAEAFLTELRLLFRSVLDRATARGELARDEDPELLADYLFGALIGLMAAARTPCPRDAVKNYVRGVLRHLGGVARTPLPDIEDDNERSDSWLPNTR